MKKNDRCRAEVAGFTSEGLGVCRVDGCAVFVPNAAPGEEYLLRITHVGKTAAHGKIEEILRRSPDRVNRLCPYAKQALMLFGSTSPSYLILESLDLVNRALSGPLPAALQALALDLAARKARLSAAGVSVMPGEALKLSIHTAAMGLTGLQAADALRRQGLEPEFADRDFLVCMVSPGNTSAELDRLEAALLSLPRTAPLPLPQRCFAPLPRAMSIRAACLAPSEEVPLGHALGRVCAAPAVSCPPAIALAVSGEVLTRQALALFEACGQQSVFVVKDCATKNEF